jgi:hypothetical protein
MSYFDLVNDSIEEAGIDLDGLTVDDFANPPDKMQRRFKKWVADSWKMVQLSREGWSFMSGRAFGIIRPRIYVEQGSLAVAPQVGELYEGASNGSLFAVAAVTLVSGSWAGGDAFAYIDMNNLSGDFELGEGFDRVSGTPVTNAFYLRGRGRYDFAQIATDFDDVDYQSVYITDSVDGSDYSQPIKFVEWNKWNDFQEGIVNDQSRPVIFTQTPDGYFDFFPALDKSYNLYFNYSRRPQVLVDIDDVPNLPEEFWDVIVWNAVLAYGRYDEKPSVVRQAQEELRPYMNLMERKFLPKIGWAPNSYDSITPR